MEACCSHGDRAGGVKRTVELKQAVCEYAQEPDCYSQLVLPKDPRLEKSSKERMSFSYEPQMAGSWLITNELRT